MGRKSGLGLFEMQKNTVNRKYSFFPSSIYFLQRQNKQIDLNFCYENRFSFSRPSVPASTTSNFGFQARILLLAIIVIFFLKITVFNVR